MQKSKQSFAMRAAYWLKVVSLGLVLGLGLQFAQAWVAPGGAPPTGNVAGPLTTGAAYQTKNGGLGLVGNLVVGSAPPAAQRQLCLNGSCIASWPSGGGGTLTSLSAGSGITLSPNPITTTGTVSLDTSAIAACTNSTTNKIYWDGANNRLACGTDQSAGGKDCRVCLRQADSSYNWVPCGCSQYPSDMPIGTPIDSAVFDAGWQDGDHHPLQFRTECR